MSGDPTTTSIPTRDVSAESTNTPVKRRRRRRTAACAQCRNRKLKCDQEYPICGRCAKGPRPSDCTYQDATQHQLPTGSNSSTSQPPVAVWGETSTVRVPDHNGVAAAGREPSSTDRPELNQTQPEAGVSTLGVDGDESGQCNSGLQSNSQFIKRHLDYTPSSKRRKTFPNEAPGLGGNILEDDELYSRDHRSQFLDIPTKTYWRGKDSRSRFYGSSLVINMISEFPDLKSYAKEIKAENPVLTKFRQDMIAVKERNHCHKHSTEKTTLSTIDSTSLFSLLPTRDIVEALVTDYLTYIEPTHRVFHITSFHRELDAVWEQEPANIQATVLVQLLLILASAWIFHKDAGNISADGKSLTGDTAKNWIRQCESWLQNNCCKRPGPAIFRIRCLFIIARDTNATRKSETWAETGSLIKLAMSSGYHREPDCQLAKISGFNREMRRRLWVTMVELDLQASLYRGMPPTIQQDDFDSIMPSNYNDEDISQEGELPQPSPSNVVTDSSFQVALARSLPLRLKICALVNAPRLRVSYEDLHWLEGEVMRHLSSIPGWQSPHTPAKPQQQQQFILWRTLLETKLGQNLLLLLSSVPPEASIPFTQFARTRLEIATTILCQQQRLLSDTNHGDDKNGRANNKLAILYPLTAAPLQAALVICHHLHTMDSGYTSKTIHSYLPSLPLSLLSLVEKTLTALEPKTVLLEKGLKECYILSMIIGLVKTKIAALDGTPSASAAAAATYRKEAVDRAAVLGYKVLAKKREAHWGDCPEWDGECHKKKIRNKHRQQEQKEQLPTQQPSQNINTTTTPISMEETPPSLGNFPTNRGNGGADLNNIQIPTLPQNFNFDFDFDWDFLLLDDVDVDMGLGGAGDVPYPGQNLGGDGFGNFY